MKACECYFSYTKLTFLYVEGYLFICTALQELFDMSYVLFNGAVIYYDVINNSPEPR